MESTVSFARALALEFTNADEASDTGAKNMNILGRLVSTLLGDSQGFDGEVGLQGVLVGEDDLVTFVSAIALESTGLGREGSCTGDRTVATELGLSRFARKYEGSASLARPELLGVGRLEGSSGNEKDSLSVERSSFTHEFSLACVLCLAAKLSFAIAKGGLDSKGSFAFERLRERISRFLLRVRFWGLLC